MKNIYIITSAIFYTLTGYFLGATSKELFLTGVAFLSGALIVKLFDKI